LARHGDGCSNILISHLWRAAAKRQRQPYAATAKECDTLKYWAMLAGPVHLCRLVFVVVESEPKLSAIHPCTHPHRIYVDVIAAPSE
jgi:hypothetical protein